MGKYKEPVEEMTRAPAIDCMIISISNRQNVDQKKETRF